MKNCAYIAEIFLPNTSAYSTHVIKMCDNLSKKFDSCELFIINSITKNSFKDIKHKYLLTSKKDFKITNVTSFTKSINIYERLIFGFCVAKILKKKETDLIISRSLIASFFLCIFGVKHFLEIHHVLKGLTKFIFINLDFINSKSIKRVIFISKILSKKFKVDRKLILHDAIDLDNFSKNKRVNKIKNVGYIGSLFDGRGIDTIKKLSIMNPDLNFFIIGKRRKDKKKLTSTKNLKFLNFVEYKKVPSLLSKFDILLMPYKKIVNINSSNLNTAEYCSPLKMFDYLASGKAIISSKLGGINEVLKHKKNSFLVEGDDIHKWNRALQLLKNDKHLVKKISANALLTSKQHTWLGRIKKINRVNY